MKILIISRYPPFPGGRENFVFELVSELSKFHEVLIVTPDVEDGQVGSVKIYKYPESKSRLEKIITDFSPDLINSHTFYLSIDSVEISHRLNIPFGITLHGDQFAIGDKQRQDIVSQVVRMSDFVINVSENGRRSIIKNVTDIDHKKIHVILNGVNISRFNKNVFNQRNTSRIELGIPTKKFVVLSVTRIVSYKGLDFLFDAIIENKDFLISNNFLFLVSVPDFPFSVEEATLFDLMKKRIVASDIKTLVSFVFLKYNEMEKAYSSADIFLTPSQKEQLPVSILEAMACELPIIATKVGGIPELLTDERDSLLVDFGDTKSLFTNIMKFFAEDRKSFTDNAFKKVWNCHSIEKVTKEYVELYTNYLS